MKISDVVLVIIVIMFVAIIIMQDQVIRDLKTRNHNNQIQQVM